MARFTIITTSMLRISKLTDYAMLIVNALVKSSPGEVLSANTIAKALHLTLPTVSKILKLLAEANIVVSTRGAEGGYQLARAPSQITIVDMITAIEGEMAVTTCCSQDEHCAIDSFCALRQNWRTINNKIRDLLAGLTILDLSRPI